MNLPPRHPPSKPSPVQAQNNSNANDSSKIINMLRKTSQDSPGRRSSLSASPASKYLPSILPDDDDEPYSSKQALDEAHAVMSSQGYTSGQLANFNLLEVVTNPRGGSSIPSTSTHKSIPSSSSHGLNLGATSATSIDVKKKLELGVPTEFDSITGKLNSMTTMLDSFSRDYLGTSPIDPQSTAMEEYEGWYYDSENTSNHLSAAALQELLGTEPLPEHLQNVDLQGLEDWLNHCCGLAFKFVARGQDAEGVVMDNFDEEDDADEMHLKQKSEESNEENTQGDNSEQSDYENSMSEDTNIEKEEDDCLGTPPIYFSPYFDLTNPQTFEDLLLSNDAGLVPKTPKNISKPENGENNDISIISTTESMLQKQESLTSYLDNIELSLLHQVRIKSHQFFRETDNFNFLKKLISESVSEVKELRDTLSKLKQNAVLDVEQIPKMAQQRTALKQISSLLEKVDNVVQAKASVSGLMATEDYLGVVQAFDSARSLLDNDHLSQISALAQVKDQFQSYERIVVENMSTALVERFLSWSSMGDDEGEEKKMMDTNGNSASISTSKMTQVKIILQALEKLKKMQIAQNLYEVRLADMVKVTIKTTVTECAADASTVNDDNNMTSATVNNNHAEKVNVTDCVKNMTFAHFMNCLDMLFEQLLSVLRGAVKVDTFLKEEGIPLQQTQKQKNHPQTSKTLGSEHNSMINSSAALSGATELAHKSISDLLRARKEAHSLVSFEEMKSLWDKCLSFTSQLEKCTHGSKAYMLRQTLLAQARSFLERKHESGMAGLAAALDREKWVQCDVSF